MSLGYSFASLFTKKYYWKIFFHEEYDEMTLNLHV